jgi:radical SAM superfamily enzyme YgiQ (UPF0313 family)
LIKAMAQAKCDYIFLGIESASPRILRAFNKMIPLSKASRVVKECVANGIEVMTGFIIGHPLEGRGELNQTLRLITHLRLLNAKFEISILEPFPGTKIYESFKKDLCLLPEIYRDGTALVGKEEWKLIRKFPEIFSNFYYVKSNHFSLKYMKLIADSFEAVIYHFPATLHSHYRRFNTEPLDVFERVNQWIAKIDSEAMDYVEGFILFYKEFLDLNPSPVRDIFAYENERYLEKRDGEKSPG